MAAVGQIEPLGQQSPARGVLEAVDEVLRVEEGDDLPVRGAARVGLGGQQLEDPVPDRVEPGDGERAAVGPVGAAGLPAVPAGGRGAFGVRFGADDVGGDGVGDGGGVRYGQPAAVRVDDGRLVAERGGVRVGRAGERGLGGRLGAGTGWSGPG
ncbi:hypothetical protein [Actinacidiphila sp. ITFR-21]|uniref:hypothetical protein n=1 Tax=Actinacidiphila sp. ITFR-21 TaxID=3075199 RepID=UPI00288B3DDC|nr:hypothetical protein [Streptomyces sp. ITFR-21]WNI16811.1 hypothetical protein RLT57_15660 [Streptomyces sp. ITFR-21]